MTTGTVGAKSSRPYRPPIPVGDQDSPTEQIFDEMSRRFGERWYSRRDRPACPYRTNLQTPVAALTGSNPNGHGTGGAQSHPPVPRARTDDPGTLSETTSYRMTLPVHGTGRAITHPPILCARTITSITKSGREPLAPSSSSILFPFSQKLKP